MSVPIDHHSSLRASGLRSPAAAFYPGSHLIEVWAEEDEGPFESFAFLIHERIHYLQAIGTTCGIYYADSLNYRASAITTAASKVARSLGNLRIPLREWRNQREIEVNLPEDMITRRLNRAIYFADRLDSALCRFLGFDTIYNPMDPHLQGISFSGSHYASITPPQTAVHPKINTRFGQATISGAPIMESFALYWQVYAEHFFPNHRPYEHSILVGTIERLGHVNSAAYLLYASLIEHVARVFGYASLWIFPIIADIALSGPLPMVEEAAQQEVVAHLRSEDSKTTVNLRLGKTPTWKWEDIHPGWRFCRVVDELAKSSFLERYSDCDYNWDKVYSEITSWVCDRLSWDTPSTVAKQWVQTTHEQPLRPATIPAIRERRLAAMMVRSQRPWVFAFPGYFLTELGDQATPPVFLCGALPTPTANVIHVAEQDLGLFFYVHLINHWADLLLPLLTLSFDPSNTPGRHACPFTSDNYRCVCKFESKQLCSVGQFPKLDCFYQREFYQQFGIQLEDLTLT